MFVLHGRVEWGLVRTIMKTRKNEIETSVQIISQTLPLDEIQKYFKIGNIYGKSNCFHDLSKIARIVEYGCQNAE